MDEPQTDKEPEATPTEAKKPSIAEKAETKKRKPRGAKEKEAKPKRPRRGAAAAVAEKPKEPSPEAAAPAKKPRTRRRTPEGEGAPKQVVDETGANEKAIQALREYVALGVTFDELAAKYGFSGWEEFYELYKKVPAWQIWQAGS